LLVGGARSCDSVAMLAGVVSDPGFIMAISFVVFPRDLFAMCSYLDV
jgi:hypothetical protein